ELGDRPKQGFAVPVAHWLRHELRDWAEALLDVQRLDREGYWNTSIVRAFWNDHTQGKGDHSFYLWSILMFQAWLEHQCAQGAPALLRA
ncbi:MAG: asparagine synthetase B, partial [Ectothiorhodospiraceae bacterium]|nr:asparagine synthetase B [Ectothiorhodospiraceae bacterium]